jgi:hypothetical protein
MNTPTTVLEAQTQTMLEYLRRYEVEQIKVEMDRGHRIAAELLQNAHRRARKHMHDRIQRERQRMRAAEQSAEARLATRKRVAAHSRITKMIGAARQLLPAALEARWTDDESRQAWCDTLLRQTRRSLQGPEILVEHPEDWRDDERRAFLLEIEKHFGRRPKARADDGLVAGLRIHSGNAWLDGSVAGLLARRNQIDEKLAAHLAEARNAQSEEASTMEAAHG